MIDSFCRIKELHAIGIKIHLHCFEYGRQRQNILNQYCTSVYYYPRATGIISNFSIIPFIVLSRKNKTLLNRLLADNYPILFDGLHTTYYIKHPGLKNRIKLVRAHNIEHKYLTDIMLYEHNVFKKLFFIIESARMKWFEKNLAYADKILAISEHDHEYFSEKYNKSVLVRPFHPFNSLRSKEGSGKYLLYHGNLSLSINYEIVNFLIKNVFSQTNFPVIIAGKLSTNKLISTDSKYNNIKIIQNPDEEEMLDLISGSHISIPYSYENNGMKLKLLYSLFAGRHCITNLVSDNNSGLNILCHYADTADEIRKRIDFLINKPLTSDDLALRDSFREKYFNNHQNSETINNILFK